MVKIKKIISQFTQMQLQTTEVLQKNFSSTYEEFFSRNSLIVSGSFYAPWGPMGFWKRGAYPVIKSCSNLKMYVGINQIESSTFEFWSITYFETQGWVFKSTPFNSYHSESKNIQQYLSEELNITGVRIEILSEGARGHCLGFSGTFASTLCYWLLKAGLISNETKAIEIAKYIGHLSKYWNSSGDNESFTWYAPDSIQAYIQSASNCFAKVVDEVPQLPFYHWVLFCWMESSTKTVESRNVMQHNDLEQLARFLADYPQLQSTTEQLKRNNDETLYQTLLNQKHERLLLPVLKHISLLHHLSVERKNPSLESEFIDNVNEIQRSIEIIEWSSYFAERLKAIFKNLAPSESTNFWIFPVYSSSLGGSYVFFLKKNPDALTLLERLLTEANKQFLSLSIEHFSDWSTRSDMQALHIEQNLESGILWKFKDPSKITFQEIGKESVRIGINDAVTNFTQWVLIDTVGNKIFINGTQLNSKDHPSQHTLVQVMVHLLESLENEISSKVLGSSTYTKNKSEMSSKIFNPFVKLTEKHFWRPVKFVCKWSISDFFVKFEQNEIPFAIIKP